LRNQKTDASGKIRHFVKNEPISGVFLLSFESHAENIKISQPDVKVDSPETSERPTEDVLKVQPHHKGDSGAASRVPSFLSGETSERAQSWVQVDVTFPKGIRSPILLARCGAIFWRRSGSPLRRIDKRHDQRDEKRFSTFPPK